MMDFSVFKLNHEWWHFFFTNWFKTTHYGELGTSVEYYCSKCQLIHTVRQNEVGVIKELSQRKPK